jgi:hypothetical protein
VEFLDLPDVLCEVPEHFMDFWHECDFFVYLWSHLVWKAGASVAEQSGWVAWHHRTLLEADTSCGEAYENARTKRAGNCPA